MALMHVLILGFGGLLLAIPVVLHLMMQPKPKVLTFPAIRFVQQMQRTNQRSLRLKHWLLLAIRCLLLLVVAAALARPSTNSAAFGDWLNVGAGGFLSLLCGLVFVFALLGSKPANIPLAVIVGAVLALALSWTGYSFITATGKGSGNLLTDRQAPVAAAVIIDSSPRMQYRFQNSTLLQKAQDEARWIVSQLPRESRVSVIRNDGQPPFFSVDIGAARKRINTVETSFASTLLPETIESAIRFLKDTPQERKEIYVLSDMTEAGWATAGFELRQLLEEQTDISLYLMDVGVEQPTNLSLDEQQLSGSSIPLGGTITVNAQLRAVGEGGEMIARLWLEKPDLSRPVRRDGQTLLPEQHWMRETIVNVAENATSSFSLSLQDDFQTGIHHGWIELEASDSLDIDNRLYFTVDVQPSWNVLVAHPEGVDPGNLVDTLEPGDGDSGGYYNVTVVSQRNLAQELLEEYNAIFLLDPGPISDPLWKILENYTQGGGGLGIFLGHNAAADSQPHGAFMTEAAAAVLPGRLVRMWRTRRESPQGNQTLISLDNLTHPALKPFRPYDSLGIWQPFPVHRHWELEQSSDPEVSVVARFTDGIASVLQRRIGDGRVICVTTPITEPAGRSDDLRLPWNDLFNSAGGEVWPAWLLVSSISEYLSSGTRDRLNLLAGQTATIENDRDAMPNEYRLFSPRDEEPVRVVASENSVRYKFTDMPGTYRLKGQLDGPVLRGFSVNLPSGVTNLKRIDPDRFDEMLGEDRYQLAEQRNELQRQQGTTRQGQEFYPILALLMSLLVALS